MPLVHCTGLMEVVVKTLSEAVVTHQSGEGHVRKTDQLVLPAVLELLHNVLKRTSVIVRSALKVFLVVYGTPYRYRVGN